MDHCARRGATWIVFEPCGSVLAAERSVKRRIEEGVGPARDSWKLSSVVGGTRKHEWVAGDKVRIAS